MRDIERQGMREGGRGMEESAGAKAKRGEMRRERG